MKNVLKSRSNPNLEDLKCLSKDLGLCFVLYCTQVEPIVILSLGRSLVIDLRFIHSFLFLLSPLPAAAPMLMHQIVILFCACFHDINAICV